MHNNGTTPLILPADKKLLPDLKPETGVRLHATPGGVLLVAYNGSQELPLLMPVHKAAELGVSLISAAALLQHGAVQPSSQIVVPQGAAVPKS